jgi:hypothetical protein
VVGDWTVEFGGSIQSGNAAIGEKQHKVRDSELPGFFVLIGKRRKTFMAQGEFWRDGVREFTAQVKLGDFGEMTTR